MLKVKKIWEDALLPTYGSKFAAGMDLYTYGYYTIEPYREDGIVVVHTGIAVQIPDGYEMQIRPRSGLSIMFPNYVVNSPGTIDSDYRGELKIPVANHSSGRMFLNNGDRIAQGIVTPVKRCMIYEVDSLDDTERGANGFGSTGR